MNQDKYKVLDRLQNSFTYLDRFIVFIVGKRLQWTILDFENMSKDSKSIRKKLSDQVIKKTS
ncbi:hypothetical protein HanHA300_Chr06g0200261 [Helianthus annuus]|nr:hypothetical protein HanHA300_Chr06g0200261 [Helianthus annuus]KAJ0572405.1 hypothetical protein HanHA89_Chr06g0215351 [Helianthus annuus]